MNTIKEKIDSLIYEKIPLVYEAGKAEADIKFASIHDDLASIIPKDGEPYIIKYHDMPAKDNDEEPDENGEYPTVISGAVDYRVRIGDGVTALSDLPDINSIQYGEGIGSLVQIDPTYHKGQDFLSSRARAAGQMSLAQGLQTKATGQTAAAFNYGTTASGKRSFACCYHSVADGEGSFAANQGKATGGYSSAFGISTASAPWSFASNYGNEASGKYSCAVGNGNKAMGEGSYAEGQGNVVEGAYAHVEGCSNKVYGKYSHCGGADNFVSVDGENSLVSGYNHEVSGNNSLASGYHNIVKGENSFVMGKETIIEGNNSGSIGSSNTVKSNTSFAIGSSNEIGSTVGSHAGCFIAGNHNKVTNNNMAAFGRYNKPVASAPLVVGWGGGEDSRNNILELYRTGVLRVNTSYQTPEGDEATLQLGETKLTETLLKDVLNLTGGEIATLAEVKEYLGI